jgi:hypothetical protein
MRVVGVTAIFMYTAGYFFIDKKDAETFWVTTILLVALLLVVFVGVPLEYMSDQKTIEKENKSNGN